MLKSNTRHHKPCFHDSRKTKIAIDKWMLTGGFAITNFGILTCQNSLKMRNQDVFFISFEKNMLGSSCCQMSLLLLQKTNNYQIYEPFFRGSFGEKVTGAIMP